MEVLSLYERGMGLFSTLSLEPLSERLVEGLCLETRAQGGVIWVADGLGETRLRLCGARGIVQLGEESEELQADALPREIAELEKPEVAHVVTGADADSALWLPVRHSGGLVAVARLTDKLESDAFDHRDVAAGTKFVSVGGLALVNALRFRSLERRSFRDPVTKAYTHAFFADVIRNEIQKANRFGRHFSIVRVDLGALGELRRSEGDQQLGHWLEGVVGQVGQALRSTDLLAVENEHRFAVLLPETDALGGAVLKERIRRSVEDSGVLDSLHTDMRRELTLAVATFPTDGTQLDALERVLEDRLQEHGSSPLRRLDLQDLRFVDAVEALLEEGEPLPSVFPAQAVQFLRDQGFTNVSNLRGGILAWSREIDPSVPTY